ncbi:MAG: flagellar biosynthesis protein FlhB [Gammaproteobacteria bacterium]|nr:flagellar biosynthesis protein FlhB [Gammaproteobacteria bacterium]MCP5298853.1 flagellar biosynthesis protein FlhB [Chromatiaceae bacterium]
MAENQDGQEKSQEPTAKRVTEARRKGQIPRSRELNTMAITMFGLASLIMLGPRFASGLHTLFEEQFSLPRKDIFDTAAMMAHLIKAIGDALQMLLPFFGLMVAIAILSSVVLGGLNVSFEAMQPKLSKINPLQGFKRIFSVKGLMELVKSIGKFALVGSATVLLLNSLSNDLLGLSQLDIDRAIGKGMTLVAWSSVALASTLILMAAIDVPFQLWQHRHDLKMTQQEVRDELKETEGRPEVKGRIRQMQREIAQRRMMQEVPKADVVVTNPTHYAVALRYDPDKMYAPIVVAMGKDLIAANIRDIAAAHDVPQVEAPELARAIYFNTELNQAIPAALFLAVAQLLAYVFQLRAWQETGGDIPTPPQDYPVPEDYRHA